ncbi:MAG: ABC transporter ATP-binding protein [Prevotellaceae bacterium]|jgi:ABC-type sugar transport system ATPase subunit|nr:ABC transporter ATP-binding protein [Prevotellaceae bacterium]
MLEIKDLTYTVGSFTLPPLSLTIEEGSYTMLLGPSGSGKSVLLELIAGLRKPGGGSIWLDGKKIDALPPAERSLGLLFQDYALFPHLSVYQNIGYALRLRHLSKEGIREQVKKVACAFEIESLLHRFPDGLSGGERQRVALARCLVVRPRLLLLDEPLSALDASLRSASRTFLKKINQSGQTIIHVTHDVQEREELATFCWELQT